MGHTRGEKLAHACRTSEVAATVVAAMAVAPHVGSAGDVISATASRSGRGEIVIIPS